MKKSIAILMCLVLLFSLTSPVFAMFETSSSALNASANQLKRGETFTVTATLTNSDVIGMGAVALIYDSAVFEMVSGACLVQAPAGLMLFPVVLPEEGVGSFTFFSMAGDSTAVVTGDLFSFEMKVKDNAPFGTFEIGNETSIGVDTSNILDNSTGVSITVKCDHIMGENWVQDDAQNHKKECTVSGCGHKITEAHNFGDWVKVDNNSHKRTCSVATCGYVDTQAHNFNQQVISDAYKADDASCTNKATYYYSCSCGAKGTTTFETGSTLPHVYDQEKVAEAYKVSGATCTKKAVYNHSCVCGVKGTTTFEAGSLLAHVYDKQVATEQYKATPATCITQATYYKSCYCGAKGTETFAAGALADHTFEIWEKVDGDTHKSICSVVGCGEENTAKHTYSEQLTAGEETHWNACVCGEKKDEVKHTYDETKWETDADNHWHVCACGAKSEAVKHNWDEGKVTVEATTEKAGEKTFTCKDCGKTKTEELPKVEAPEQEPPKQEETTPKEEVPPKTGDEFQFLTVLLLALLSAFGVVVSLLLKKRKAF